ncbi:Fur family transcriptional regulator [Arthrobacter sp. zg-Y1219]|uniref:Fur family transcriptional regulator n=1 Tax=Arthrobacter sp. zg-Y1219 TaxID=3049067 RepID=UPI0024C24BEC|nr:Fur family transcriptional regulator [Arthrobacter sp. zg-Y1219]MDK1359210.1 Fur family transcriptional regulator [Arthrobacter sp. zg-Y1219]
MAQTTAHAGPAGPALTALQVSAALRHEGLRATIPRLDVYRALAVSGGHRSADDLAGMLAADGGTVQRTSVYNALRALVDAGLVQVVQAGPGTTLYELRGSDHHHFLCRDCGTITDVPAGSEVPPLLDMNIPGARVDSAQVVLRGLCADCLEPH